MMDNPKPTEKQRAWLLPAERQQLEGPGLYLVSTPIGNLGDITLRALDFLAACDAVACEDTRVTGRLLQYYGINRPLLSYNDHSDERRREEILQRIKSGEKVALVSDAGTPLISDPGFKLVRACVENGLHVTSLPGANAILPALQLSGLGSDSFCFAGFLPAKSGERKNFLKTWQDVPATLVFFDTGPRLSKSLQDILEVCGDRAVAVMRELTKLYEEVRRGPVSELTEFYASADAPKGEIVLLMDRAGAPDWDDKAVEKALRKALKSMSNKEAARHVAEQSGRRKSDLYDLALTLK